MVLVADRSVACATCDRINPCKNQSECAADQSKGRIPFKLSGPITTMRGGVRGFRGGDNVFGTCLRHVNSDFTSSLLAPKRLVQLGQAIFRSVRLNGEKAMVPIADRSDTPTCNCANPCKGQSEKTAGQTNIRTPIDHECQQHSDYHGRLRSERYRVRLRDLHIFTSNLGVPFCIDVHQETSNDEP